MVNVKKKDDVKKKREKGFDRRCDDIFLLLITSKKKLQTSCKHFHMLTLDKLSGDEWLTKKKKII